MNGVEIVKNELAWMSVVSAQSIASFFESSGVKGHKVSAIVCPVAVYLNHRLIVSGSEDSICVGPLTASVGDVNTEGGRYTELTLPESVQQFITAFDRGEFPQLEKVVLSAGLVLQ